MTSRDWALPEAYIGIREGLQQDGLTSQREESRSELSHFSLHPSDDGVPTPMIKQKKRRKKERKKESEAPFFMIAMFDFHSK